MIVAHNAASVSYSIVANVVVIFVEQEEASDSAHDKDFSGRTAAN